ncbi:MAG TPA: hypothetical protein PKY59_14220 [Pyrinomonadaceae bacterium]|nr:hypothetical protein [Pyrinomonadaceae bacterium]
MNRKLGIIGGLILTLAFAGSAFANTGGTHLKNTKSAVKTSTLKLNKTKPKKHREHRKHRKHKMHKAKIKTNDGMKKPNK